GGVAEHAGQRYRGLDALALALALHAEDLAAAGGEVPHDVAHELLGHRDLHLHDRLQQHRAGPVHGVLESHRARHREGHLAGVDVVVAAVLQRRLHVHHREARQLTVLQRLSDPLLNRRDVLPGDLAAHDLVDELEALARLVGLDLDLRVAVLAAAAGLAHEAPPALGGPADALAV